jgi:hypothetical protein
MARPPLLVLVPSRERPSNLTRLLGGIAATSAGKTDVLVLVDDDDPTKPQYLEAVHEVGFAWLESGPRPAGIGPLLNVHAVHYASSYQAIGFMGDDHLPQTTLWDALVMEALDDLGATGICYGDDRFQSAALPTAVFLASCIVRALGRMVPHGLLHLFLDDYWLQLGRLLHSIRYLPEVVIEHHHPAATDPATGRPKAPVDPSYVRTNRPELWEHDGTRWRAYQQAGQVHRDAAVVTAHCLGEAV